MYTATELTEVLDFRSVMYIINIYNHVTERDSTLAINQIFFTLCNTIWNRNVQLVYFYSMLHNVIKLPYVE